ncbi:MAG: hypothetical protein AAFY76_04570 [Cyanobacteria bacterium J06649_11]
MIGTETVFFGQIELGFGVGEKDTLTGGTNNDTFILGLETAKGEDENGQDTEIEDVILYNKSNIDNAGTNDYALITDFGFENDGVIRGLDRIQLVGSENDYSLGSSVQKLRDDFFKALPDNEANKNAFETGQQIASKIVQERENDGSQTAQLPYTPGNAIGDWQFTFKDGETTNQQVGFVDEALLPNWGLVTPFVLEMSIPIKTNEKEY